MRWLGLLALAGCASAGPAGDWPRWRGPGGAAWSDAAPLPTSWSASRQVAWSSVVPGEGSSSPIVDGDAVFLTSSLDDGTRRLLHRLDRRSGAILWSVETKDPNPERSSALTGHAAATPATDGIRVVAAFGNAGVVCVDFSGSVLWRRALGEFDSELGLASSPILHDGRVLLLCDHDGEPGRSFPSFLLALDLRTGVPLWKQERRGLFRSWSTPIVVGNRLIVSGQDELRAYDVASGTPLWSVPGMSGWVTPSPVSDGAIVIATSGKDGPTIAVRPDGAPAWRVERGGPYVCSPLLHGGLLYVVDETGRLICRDAADGSEVYRERLRGKFTASPVGGDGKLYVTNEEGTTFVLKAGRRFERLAENALGEECLASPALSGGDLFLRTRRRLWCIRGGTS